MSKDIRVSADNDGRRLDRILRNMYPEVPLGAIMKAIRLKEVRVDAGRASGDMRVSEGQVITVPWKKGAGAPPPKRRFGKLAELYRDSFVWITDKPAGLLTQPDRKGGDSLITRVLAELKWTRRDFRPSTVQRLDRNTSGAVMVAMSGKAQRVLSEMMRERFIKKIYVAPVCGKLDGSGEISLPLTKDSVTNTVRVDPKGKAALTRYSKLRSAGDFTLVELELITGRSHQARVHLSSLGYPIAGDFKYGGAAEGARRPLLHAYKLEFPDDAALPQELRGRTVTAPIPADLKEFLNEV